MEDFKLLTCGEIVDCIEIPSDILSTKFDPKYFKLYLVPKK